MKKLGFLLIACTLIASISKSYADDNLGIYLGLGGGFTFGNLNTYKSELDKDEYKGQQFNVAKLTHNANVVLGYNIIPYLAVEAEYAYGFAQKLAVNDNFPNKDKYDFSSHLFFANVIGKYEFTEGNTVFVKAGVGYAIYNMLIEKKEYGTKEQEGYEPPLKGYAPTLSGFTFQVGAGYEFAFNAHNSLSLAYMFKMTPSLSMSDTKDSDIFASYIAEMFKKSLKDKNMERAGASSVQIAYKFTF